MFPGACPLKFGQRGKFALKIGPDWGIFSRANIGGKYSLRHELPRIGSSGFLRHVFVAVGRLDLNHRKVFSSQKEVSCGTVVLV